MNKLEITKLVVNLVVGAGVGRIASEVIANNVSEPDKVIHKVTLVAGSVVIGAMAKDATKKYTSAKIDELAEAWSEFKSTSEKTTEEPAVTS